MAGFQPRDSLASVVNPACTEEESLPHLNTCPSRVLERCGRPYEVVLIDGGSADRSREILAELAKRADRLRIITLRTNLGKSMALAAGFRKTRENVIVTMDADSQDDP